MDANPMGAPRSQSVSVSISKIENGYELRGHGDQQLRFERTAPDRDGYSNSRIQVEYANGMVVYAYPTLEEAQTHVGEVMEEVGKLLAADIAQIEKIYGQKAVSAAEAEEEQVA